jgi:hypothetical protein
MNIESTIVKGKARNPESWNPMKSKESKESHEIQGIQGIRWNPMKSDGI